MTRSNMLIQQKSGNLAVQPTKKDIDWLELEWYETNKRVLHKKTRSGREISMRFLKENQCLTQGDIIFEDTAWIIAVHIKPAECIVIRPKSMLEMAAVCYEVGNQHVALFFENDELLIPFETPLFNLFSLRYHLKKETRILINPLKTSVVSHVQISAESVPSTRL